MKKYLSYITVIALLFVIVSCTSETNDSKGFPSKEMKVGYYESYSVQKAFNTTTGEPVYWIIAATIKMEGGWLPVNQGDIRFYEVPRSRITNIPDNVDADPSYIYQGRITVL